MHAEILVDQTTGGAGQFALDHIEGLRSHHSTGERFDSDVERTLVKHYITAKRTSGSPAYTAVPVRSSNGGSRGWPTRTTGSKH